MSPRLSSAIALTSQFSLRSLMIGLTLVCVVCAMIALPVLLAVLIAIGSIVVSGLLGITIWKGRGWVQVFAVGAILPQAMSLIVMFSSNDPVEGVIAAVFLQMLV